MAEYAFGIDVGGTTVKCGLFNVKGDLLEKWEIPTRKEDGGKYILGDIADAIKDKCREKGLKKEDILGVGIGVPGPVLEDGIVNNCVNLGWGVVDVKETLSGLLDEIPVAVGNDANVAALGEQWKGGGSGYKNVVLVTLGTGVGGGIIIGGKIIPGSHGAGGEIGDIQVDKNETVPCNCGKKGCLEQYASATGVVRMAKRYLAKSKKTTVLKDDETLSAKTVFDAAKANDAAALDVVEQFGERLGTALAAINCVVDPEVVVIGGGVSKAGQIILDVVQKYYIPAAFNACRNCLFKLAELGNEAGMYGAVRMVLQK